MIESTSTIEDRLTRMENTLESIAQGVNQAPILLSMATDSVDEIIQESNRGSTKFDDRLQSGLQLLGRLSDPKLNGPMNQLLDILEQGAGLTSMAMDIVDESVGQINAGPILLEDRIKGFKILIDKLSDPAMLENFTSLIKFSHQAPGLAAMSMDILDDFMRDNKVMNAETLELLMKTGEAVTEAQKQEPEKVGGIFGLLKALKDPGRQKALGFTMNILKNLGNKI